MLKTAATFAIILCAVPLARAAPGECKAMDGPILKGTYETYLAVSPASSRDTRASEVVIRLPPPLNGTISQGWQIRLNGFLFMPAIPAGETRPVIVYNHGHGGTSPPCAIVDNFVNRGFIVFAPMRRGAGNPDTRTYFDDGTFKSTGLYLDLYGKAVADALCATGCTQELWDERYDAARTAYLESEARSDIAEAIRWVKTRPGADPNRIAIVGHSYGGAAVIFANQVAMGHKAAIDVSGAGLSWHSNAAFRAELPGAVEAGTEPIFFLQPENERNIEPTRVFAKAAWTAGLEYLAGVYPPVPGVDDDAGEVHGRFVKDPCEVEKWIGDAIDFLARQGVSAPPRLLPDLCPSSPF